MGTKEQAEKIPSVHELAQLLIASWRVGSGDPCLPTSHGLLDIALEEVVKAGNFPDWMRNALHFVDARTGLQCAELREIIAAAQRAELTTAPNPSYQFAQVQISEGVALSLLASLGASPHEARQWGNALKTSLENAKRELEEFRAEPAHMM